MFNPMQIISSIKQGQNPQQIVLDILKDKMSGTPLGDNIINLAENNKYQEIEQIVRNMCEQKGIDFDKEFATFRKSIGM